MGSVWVCPVVNRSNPGDASSHSTKNLPVFLAGGGFKLKRKMDGTEDHEGNEAAMRCVISCRHPQSETFCILAVAAIP